MLNVIGREVFPSTYTLNPKPQAQNALGAGFRDPGKILYLGPETLNVLQSLPGVRFAVASASWMLAALGQAWRASKGLRV